jgi:hypothetical protein
MANSFELGGVQTKKALIESLPIAHCRRKPFATDCGEHATNGQRAIFGYNRSSAKST